jgi:ATP-dependent Lhr-like helicase
VPAEPLATFHPATRRWFASAFATPTGAQIDGWARIAAGQHTLILAPTGSGKTLAAFLACLDRLMFEPVPTPAERCRVLYVSPLKALAVDIERNLRVPLAGIASEAERAGEPVYLPTVAVRTGDTPQGERARLARRPADILVSTPESLYLLLTSNARQTLRSVRWVILDEIHVMVAGKRGAHLMLSLERLEALRAASSTLHGPRSASSVSHPELQRIGLSATQRPLDEVARFLGGGEVGPDGLWRPRPVAIVDVGNRKTLELRVEVPVDDLARLGEVDETSSGSAQAPARRSIWPAIQPRLLELIRQHRSTIVFVNSRRLAERLAAALNELAGETLVYAHHGAVARDQRLEIEDALKAGQIAALVATSSLELGIDMGAVDLVIQVEAPPSVASGMQRIGRAGHQVGVPSKGVLFPKYRGDLLTCAALTRGMLDGQVEASRYPRNPLDILAQQIVAMVALDDWSVDDLYATVRRAAPFAELTRPIFEGVLDLLSGRYPADEFAELRPRLTWDRLTGQLTARKGARRVAVINGGTIPDRGLYGVFLAAGAERTSARVGELDEEMVFETRVGETFLLGASTWRVEEITHDRVLVSPAPGEPGKMPFWHGDQLGRSLELGRSIGGLVGQLRDAPRELALLQLRDEHYLDARAANNLLTYLDDQLAAAGALPDDRTVVVERCRDELGDWRLMILTPFGSRVHAPWALAIEARLADRVDTDVETLWSDDGIVVRFPEAERPPEVELLLPAADEVEQLVTRRLGSSALFAARFREAAARALLLPRRRPGARTPLWQQRRRSADLLQVAAGYASFPMLLETYRECLQDVFDLPGLVGLLGQIERRELRVVTADTDTPSPFAASLLFNYVANYIYNGDAPLAERRAQLLSVDQAQLRELLGEAELRELLDSDALAELELRLQGLDPTRPLRSADGLHDLLLRVGDLTDKDLATRAAPLPFDKGKFSGPDDHPQAADDHSPDARQLREPPRSGGQGDLASWLADLEGHLRILQLPIAGQPRWIAVEDAARYRDALGVPLPSGLPDAFLEPVRDPLGDLAARFARTHGPFQTVDLAQRLGLGVGTAELALRRLEQTGRLLRGEFRPGGQGREWCDAEVLRQLRQRSLARLRREVEPVEPAALGRFLPGWHGLGARRNGPDDLLEVIEQLQGAAIPFSVLESDVLPARLPHYRPGDLDQLIAAGEVVWVGLEPLGERDGRIGLYLTDQLPLLRVRAAGWVSQPGNGRANVAHDQSNESVGQPVGLPLRDRLRAILAERGAQFFAGIQAAIGTTWPNQVLEALWELVWAGEVTNDGLAALRAYAQAPAAAPGGRRGRPASGPLFRSRRAAPPRGAGRWSLVESLLISQPGPTERVHALTSQLLERHGVLTREAVAAEGVPGGFAAVYPVLRAMEEAGRLRRGYFVDGRGATQFALPAALDRLRTEREAPEQPRAVVLAATDPSNPYGAALRWPTRPDGRAPARSPGALVVLIDGEPAAYLGRGERSLLTWPAADPARAAMIQRATVEALGSLVRQGRLWGLLLATVVGPPARASPLAPALEAVGFRWSISGYFLRPPVRDEPIVAQPAAGTKSATVRAKQV